MLEPVRDRSGLLQDLDLLRMGPNEVEDLVVSRLGVLEKGGQGRDGLAGAGRGVDQERAPGTNDLVEGTDDRLLARTQPVGEQERPAGRRVRRVRIELSGRFTGARV